MHGCSCIQVVLVPREINNPSQIKGEFLSTYATPLDYWHLAEEFGAEPALDSTFIEQIMGLERT